MIQLPASALYVPDLTPFEQIRVGINSFSLLAVCLPFDTHALRSTASVRCIPQNTRPSIFRNPRESHEKEMKEGRKEGKEEDLLDLISIL
mmetsp:Transcript_1550/g.3239  ORF Transcript_1550/g.3239 Transcript_1550/m.3239 type:complete len:90 (+) Transcript_1550:332-601(+)